MNAAPPRRVAAYLIGCTLVLLLTAGAAIWWWGRHRPAPDDRPAPVERHLPEDPRLSYAGPYRNVRPEVRYVGTAACAECHESKADSFREHPMGRSVVPVPALADRQPYDPAHNNPFEAFGTRFLVERDGDRVRHRRTAFDDAGRPVYDFALEADYAIGSGTRGYSYLSNRDGFLVQTPISWYSQKQRWDVSPGFGAELLVGRAMTGDCLFCHINHAEPEEGTVNHYPPALFDGQPIGCERCHGPGELHAEARRRKDPIGDFDPTIVNPGRLAPALREAVCEQCHLEGAARLVRRGRGLYDYRPGLPLSAFWAVFVRARPPGGGEPAVNQVEQMYDSGCFRGGRGDERIGCVSCHDPHQRVAPERRVEHYRRACLSCHDQHGCSLPVAQRLKESPQDSCIACHMPRYSAADIPHTAATDHRIPRRRAKEAAGPPEAGGEFGLTSFYRDGTDNAELLTRDLGLALAQLAEGGKVQPQRVAPHGVALLGSAVVNDPEDWPAWEARAHLLTAQGRRGEALVDYRRVLAGAPRRETALADGADLARQLGQRDLAIDYWRRAIAVNPWAPEYRGGLATLLAAKEAWDELGPACREWLRLDPASVEARMLWITALLRTGRKDEARAEFDKVKALRPPQLAKLQAWFARESR